MRRWWGRRGSGEGGPAAAHGEGRRWRKADEGGPAAAMARTRARETSGVSFFDRERSQADGEGMGISGICAMTKMPFFNKINNLWKR
jgi:hypothetical protein